MRLDANETQDSNKALLPFILRLIFLSDANIYFKLYPLDITKDNSIKVSELPSTNNLAIVYTKKNLIYYIDKVTGVY